MHTLRLGVEVSPPNTTRLDDARSVPAGYGGRRLVDFGGGRTVPSGRSHGWTTIYYPHHGLVTLEGCPALDGDRLGSSTEVMAAASDVVAALNEAYGVTPRSEPRARRVDCAVTLGFSSTVEGIAFLTAIAQVRFPRQKLDVIGSPPETVYGLAERGRGKKLWRCYDSGLCYGTADRGIKIRMEDQWQPRAPHQPLLRDLVAEVVGARFGKRFSPLLNATSEHQVVTMPGLITELSDRVRNGTLDHRGYERMYSFISAEAAGLDRVLYSKDVRKRRRREVKNLGLRVSMLKAPIAVDLASIFERATAPDVWA